MTDANMSEWQRKWFATGRANFEKRTGLSELIYGMSCYEAKKESELSSFLDDMFTELNQEQIPDPYSSAVQKELQDVIALHFDLGQVKAGLEEIADGMGSKSTSANSSAAASHDAKVVLM